MQGIVFFIIILGAIIICGLAIAHILNHFTYYKPREKFANAISENTDLAIAYGNYRTLKDECFTLCRQVSELKKKVEELNEQLPFIPSCELDEYTTTLDIIKLQYLTAKDNHEACIIIKNKAREEVNKLLQKYLGKTLDNLF